MRAELTIENVLAVVRAMSTEQFQLWCLYASASGWHQADAMNWRPRSCAVSGAPQCMPNVEKRG